MSNIYKDLYDLQGKYRNCQEAIDECLGIIFSIGGPLNDNVKGYTAIQMKDFSNIANQLRSVKDKRDA